MRARALACAWILLCACSDDDDAPTEPDARPDAAQMDAAGDDCPHEDFPPFEPFGADRLPLATLCADACPQSLAEFVADLDCQPLPAGGLEALEFDAGFFGALLRSDGCESVQFSPPPPQWPRIYNFDAESGELIGFAQFDDIPRGRRGTSCVSHGWIGGVVRHECADEVLSLCTR